VSAFYRQVLEAVICQKESKINFFKDEWNETVFI